MHLFFYFSPAGWLIYFIHKHIICKEKSKKMVVTFLFSVQTLLKYAKTQPDIFCLLLSGLPDSADGRIARTKKNRSEQEKHFGIQIDSLNNIIYFDVLPGAHTRILTAGMVTSGLLYSTPLHSKTSLGTKPRLVLL